MKNTATTQVTAARESNASITQSTWRYWLAAHSVCEAQLRHLCEINFVWRTLWESDVREYWITSLQSGLKSAQIAFQRWDAWRQAMETAICARAVRTWEPHGRAEWATPINEAHHLWELVLASLDSAAQDHLLPDDVRNHVTRARGYYTSVVCITERARRIGEIACAAPFPNATLIRPIHPVADTYLSAVAKRRHIVRS